NPRAGGPTHRGCKTFPQFQFRTHPARLSMGRKNLGLPAISVPGELHVSVLPQKLEITYEVEILMSQLEIGQADHFRQVALPIAPVQSFNHPGIPGAGWRSEE